MSENRTEARQRSRSPLDTTDTSESPGAREIYRQLLARNDESEHRVEQSRLEEEEAMNEERRTLWLEEELRRTALLEEEEERYRQRRREDEACRTRRTEEEEERKKLFMLEMADMRETMQDMLQEALQNYMGKSSE